MLYLGLLEIMQQTEMFVKKQVMEIQLQNVREVIPVMQISVTD